MFEGQDLAVTTGYRQVLVDRMGVAPGAIDQLFPGLGGYQPLGVFQAA